MLEQPGSPISIVSYDAQYQERSRYASEGIRHDLDYRNSSSRSIRAVKFGLLSFNIFNDFLDRTAGIDMDPLEAGEESDGAWVASALADFSFFTGVAYVKQVRFLDGQIWEADLEAVASQVREIESDFDAAQLSDETAEGGAR